MHHAHVFYFRLPRPQSVASQTGDVSSAENEAEVGYTIQACDEATPPPVLRGVYTEQDRLSQGEGGEGGGNSVLVEVSCKTRCNVIGRIEVRDV